MWWKMAEQRARGRSDRSNRARGTLHSAPKRLLKRLSSAGWPYRRRRDTGIGKKAHGRPAAVRQAGGHGGGPHPILLGQTVSPARTWLGQGDTQPLMGPYKVVVAPPPLPMQQQTRGRLSSGPCASR